MSVATCGDQAKRKPRISLRSSRATLAVEFTTLAATSRLPELKPEFSLIALTFT